MGQIDELTKQYMQNPEHFADLFNYLIFNGENVIKPQNVSDVDPVLIENIYSDQDSDEKKIDELIQRYRDVIRYVQLDNGGFYAVMLGVENQSYVDYGMPVRDYLYDALQYARQIEELKRTHKDDGRSKSRDELFSGLYREDRLVPVITAVIYWDSDKWNGPRTLKDVLAYDKRLMNFIPDYSINLIEPYSMEDEDFKKFSSLLGDALHILKSSSDKDSLRELIDKGSGLRSLDRETTILLNKLLGSNIPTPEGKETIGMERVSKAIMEIRQEGIDEGRVRGREEGREEGKILGAVEALREFKVPDPQIAENIIKSYNLTPEQANIYLAESATTYGNE